MLATIGNAFVATLLVALFMTLCVAIGVMMVEAPLQLLCVIGLMNLALSVGKKP